MICAVASCGRQKREVFDVDEGVKCRHAETTRHGVGEENTDQDRDHVRGLPNNLEDDHRDREGTRNTPGHRGCSHNSVDALVYIDEKVEGYI